MTQKLYSKDLPGDLVLLDQINEGEILKCLKGRHNKDMIYTYIGPVLISVNPFKNIASLYSPNVINDYRGRYMYELPPHVYALAEDTFRQLMVDRANQCVIITGESGAGKTEASKKIMQYIAAVCGGGASEIDRVKDQLLKSNPVLEAFGNAKTVRNNNSSRFGKYMEIFFNFRGDPCGGRVQNFLLEKSRVVNCAQGERCFHVFYQLLAGVGGQQRTNLRLKKNPQDYYYLARSECFEVEHMNDREEFAAMYEGMQALGMSEPDIENVFKTVVAVLTLGDVDFTGTEEHSDIRNKDVVKVVAQLAGFDEKALVYGLTHRTVEAGGQKAIASNLNVERANYTRDALAKAMYFRLFDYIVLRVNQALALDRYRESIAGRPIANAFTEKDSRTIGVLDIYGFEVLWVNSFEQFCINFVNEKLQQIFIEKTIKSEQEEYRAEGIQWTPIEYFNNKIVCDLIESKNPVGIFAYCDEECLLPKGTDESFLAKITQHLSQHAHYAITKGRNQQFVVVHYAGDVEYTVQGFLDKNKDLVWKDLLKIGESSRLPVMTFMFPAGGAEAQGRKRPETAGSQFRTQVNILMDTLAKCVPHYIRCIKPNESKKANLFEDDMGLHQVRYLGLLENVRVRRAGFAFRQLMPQFIQRYKMLCTETWPHWEGGPGEGCSRILIANGVEEKSGFQLGKSKVFIRNPKNLFALEENRDRRIPQLVTLIQKVFRAWRARKYFLELRDKGLQLMGDNKLRRRVSVRRVFIGDYLGITTNLETSNIMAKNGDRSVIFADTVQKINKRNKIQTRTLLLTENGLYNLGEDKKIVLKRRIDLRKIAKVSVSRLPDNLFVLHVMGEYDYVFLAERKTELLAELVEEYRLLTQNKLPVEFCDSITFTDKDKSQHRITFSHDLSVPPPHKLTFAGKDLHVTVGAVDTVDSDYLHRITPAKMNKTVGKKEVRKYGAYGAGGVGYKGDQYAAGADGGGGGGGDWKNAERQSVVRGVSIMQESVDVDWHGQPVKKQGGAPRPAGGAPGMQRGPGSKMGGAGGGGGGGRGGGTQQNPERGALSPGRGGGGAGGGGGSPRAASPRAASPRGGAR